MTTELATVQESPIQAISSLSVNDVVSQVSLIQDVMKRVMKDGEHYGTIQGCGKQKVLLQPGAQVLALTFQMYPVFDIQERELDGGNREFLVVCNLMNRVTGQRVGQGIGAASTLEAKWRYRTGPVEFTGNPVPKAYWDTKASDPAGAKKLIGGDGFGTKKNPDTGKWEIVEQGEKVENENPADVMNTVLKMACKRANVSAVLNTTAASDMFTQDLDDLTQKPDDDTPPNLEPLRKAVKDAMERGHVGKDVSAWVQTVFGKEFKDLTQSEVTAAIASIAAVYPAKETPGEK